ncbi:Reverse transcriptase domain-containing protein [Caenorhabditis elegans]|uniref:Reverse transcriptase domain-containing protein n=1 Tax=Caenorhabditis elegans TaxID=6239 RepID=Q21877_CAEEL|nr:Reverse transcriptase domain-containing protein [Caenorhabditis elegans]CAA94303.2 Reverse transcriptase domain-containing protein [Caenorhabditis elegans]|eukprot:NP_501894.2 Uncharacterized protein CELE_R09E10.2 [Caenorhabditis elegans]
MSRNNTQMHITSSQLEDGFPSITNNFLTVTVNFNYDPSNPSEPPTKVLEKMSDLIGQQIANLQKGKAPKANDDKSKGSMPTVEFSRTQSMTTQQSLEDDDTQRENVPLEKKKKGKYSSEYANLLVEKPTRYRLVPSKNVKVVPEDELPKKKFDKDRKRREYVEIGKLYSKEPIIDESEVLKKEKGNTKRRSKETDRAP